MSLSMFVLYATRVVLGVYAYAIFCTANPASEAGTVLIVVNAVLMVAAMFVYNTAHAFDELMQLIAHGVGVIMTAAAGPNIIFALLIQTIGTFSDVQRVIQQLNLMAGKRV